MPQLRPHSHIRYATPASAAYPAARAGRWRARSFLPALPERLPHKASGQGVRGILIAAPISLALWMLIALAVRLFI